MPRCDLNTKAIRRKISYNHFLAFLEISRLPADHDFDIGPILRPVHRNDIIDDDVLDLSHCCLTEHHFLLSLALWRILFLFSLFNGVSALGDMMQLRVLPR